MDENFHRVIDKLNDMIGEIRLMRDVSMKGADEDFIWFWMGIFPTIIFLVAIAVVMFMMGWL